MTARPAWLKCLEADPPALLEAALWIAAEHEPTLQPAQVMREFANLRQQASAGLPNLAAPELAQPLLRRLRADGRRRYARAGLLLRRRAGRRDGRGLASAGWRLLPIAFGGAGIGTALHQQAAV